MVNVRIFRFGTILMEEADLANLQEAEKLYRKYIPMGVSESVLKCIALSAEFSSGFKIASNYYVAEVREYRDLAVEEFDAESPYRVTSPSTVADVAVYPYNSEEEVMVQWRYKDGVMVGMHVPHSVMKKLLRLYSEFEKQ